MRPAVIFDMDGVLVDSYRAHFESWRKVAAEEGIDLTEGEFAQSFGRTSREIIRSTWPLRSLDERRIAAIDLRKEEAFRQIVRRDFPVMDGARELLQAVRDAGFRVAIGSSAPPENVDLALGNLGRDLFDAVVTGMEVERGKPDPQVFLLAARRLAAQPRSCVVIEDARPGIEAARRAGMASVALVSTGRTEADFREVRPDLTIHSLAEIDPQTLSRLIDRNPARAAE
jgi:beta-phosphoglucomutase